MQDSSGKRLAAARLHRGITIDEAAFATKMRPDKIVALENDDFSRFGNNAYAKGFLLLYGRFLKVDVADQVRALETPHDIRVADYQYLTNAPAPKSERLPIRERSRKPSIAPVLIAGVVLILGFFVFYTWVNLKRIGNLDEVGQKAPAAEVTSSPELQATTAAAPPAPPVAEDSPPPAPSAPAPPVAPSPAPLPPATTAIIPAVPLTGPRSSVPAPEESLDVRRAERAVPTDAAAPPTAAQNVELIVEARKKTWVKIRKNDPNSEPIFVGDLYTAAPPLKLIGSRFFVEARDPAAVQIRRNGAPVAYQAPGIVVE